MRQLHKLGDLTGYSLQARDGEIGSLKQAYFDDHNWSVRYFVVRAGGWLLGQEVLIAPRAVVAVNTENKSLEVDLTREQIEHAPPVDTQLPVSRHYEQDYYRYYGWEPYWSNDPLSAQAPYLPPLADAVPDQPDNPHLHSSGEVQGYLIHARDGEFGHVEDFILEEPGWAVRYLEIDTRNWLPGKKLLVAPAWIQLVDWAETAVHVDLPRETIETAPEYDSTTVISREYQVALYRHYGFEYTEQ